MTLVFNELSADERARTRGDAMVRMAHMVRAIAALVGDRAPKLMAISDFDLYGTVLADGYCLAEWLHDPAADRDLRLFLVKISAKVAFDDEVSQAAKDRFMLSEFQVEDREARGLGLSYLLGTVAVSLRSESYWMRVRVPLLHTWLEDDGSVQRQDVEALNIADHEQARQVNDELVALAQTGLVGSPSRLTESKHKCFPHLQFGLDVDEQIARLPTDVVEQVITKLIVLDGAVRDGRLTGAAPALPMIHSESERTMQQYGDRRIFRGADGVPKLFEPHAMVGSSYRIHLRVDRPATVLEIGYIGKHLPTARFPH